MRVLRQLELATIRVQTGWLSRDVELFKDFLTIITNDLLICTTCNLQEFTIYHPRSDSGRTHWSSGDVWGHPPSDRDSGTFAAFCPDRQNFITTKSSCSWSFQPKTNLRLHFFFFLCRWQQEHNNRRKGNCNRNNKLHLKLERLIRTGSVLSGGLCLQMNVEKGNLHFYITNYRRCRFVEITDSFCNYYKSADVPRWSRVNELLKGCTLNFWGLNHNCGEELRLYNIAVCAVGHFTSPAGQFLFHNDLFSLWNKKLSWHHLCCDAGETACCVPLWCHSGLIKVRSLW